MRHSIATHLAHPFRGVASPSEGEKHSSRKIKISIHARECRRQNDEIHDRGRKGYVGRRECFDKRTARKRGRTASLVPGHHCHHDRNCQHVEQNEPPNNIPHGAWNGNFRMLGFSRSDGNNFHSHVTGDGYGERKPHSFPSRWQKSSVLS